MNRSIIADAMPSPAKQAEPVGERVTPLAPPTLSNLRAYYARLIQGWQIGA